MKIKDVIAKTDLTDRAIRLYIENGLVTPSFSENYMGRKNIDFSESDVEALKNIATLRKAGFSIPEIKALKEKTEERRKILSEFVSKTAEKIEVDSLIINCLQSLMNDDEITVEAICDKLNYATAEKSVPLEDIKLSLSEKIEKAVMLIIASTALFITVAYCVIIYLYYESEFLYTKIYNWFELSVAVAIPLVLIVCYALLIRSYVKPKSKIFKHKYHKIKVALIATSVVAVTVLGMLLSFLPMFVPLVYSQTENPENYLQIDHGVKSASDDIYSLFPAKIPDSVTEKYSYYNSEFHESVKYFYRYNDIIESDFDIVAQWQLPENEFQAEKKRALEDTGEITQQSEKGDWKCIYYNDYDETKRRYYYFRIFAYNEKTMTVRYIVSRSTEEYTPYYPSLEW